MDITRPPLDRQVSPAPWLAHRQQVDTPAAIRQILAEKPAATVDEIADVLAARGTQVSRMVVAMWLTKLSKERNEAKTEPSEETESGRT